jgi:hypothetical protein
LYGSSAFDAYFPEWELKPRLLTHRSSAHANWVCVSAGKACQYLDFSVVHRDRGLQKFDLPFSTISLALSLHEAKCHWNWACVYQASTKRCEQMSATSPERGDEACRAQSGNLFAIRYLLPLTANLCLLPVKRSAAFLSTNPPICGVVPRANLSRKSADMEMYRVLFHSNEPFGGNENPPRNASFDQSFLKTRSARSSHPELSNHSRPKLALSKLRDELRGPSRCADNTSCRPQA